ncbi:LamG-like jellyroll fold domain-containing protein [Chloroflexota bacterium]
MRTFRRVSRRLRLFTVVSAALVAALLISSIPNAPPPVTAASGSDAGSSEIMEASGAEEKEKEKDKDKIKLPKAIGLAKKDQDTDIDSLSKKVKLHVPKGAVDEDTEIEITEYGQRGPRMAGMFYVIEFNAFTKEKDKDPRKGIKKFNKELTLTIKHTPEELRGLDLDTLKLSYLDEDTNTWVPVSGSKYNKDTGVLTATMDHFSYWAVEVDPNITAPGRVLSFQTDLHSGAATASYPIQVPPGSGGFQPSIQLNYSSAIVDEMKSKRCVGSWVGIGWSLSLGSISYDEYSDEYTLNLNGGSTRLIQGPDGNYHTIPESYCMITRDGEQWEVYDRNGVHYQFGGRNDPTQPYDSRQYYDYDTGDPDSIVYYRWDLNRIEDTNPGNIIEISYVQDKWTDDEYKEHVRSAYPSHVKYNNNSVDIQFELNTDDVVNHPLGYGTLRKDNPNSGSLKVIENRSLKCIYIKVNDNLVRRYDFAYETEENNDPYGDPFYCGTHTLTSITEYDADGISPLPAMSFTYENKVVYHLDTSWYHPIGGNPGNPAELEWPRLVSVDNGYGGTTTYNYEETPRVDNTWTRQVVTEKTVDPDTQNESTEDQQVCYYDYKNFNEVSQQYDDEKPLYLHIGPESDGWNDEFRGFEQVTVTDAEDNYTKHYFYTTGEYDGETRKGEILTGKEYRTEAYDAANNLLERKEFEWKYDDSTPSTLESNAVGYWTLDETATDSSGLGNNGTLVNGPTWTADGWFGSALHFDGVDDYVELGTDSSLNLTGDFTLSAWVKRDSLDTEDYVLESGWYGVCNYSLMIDGSSDGKISFTMGSLGFGNYHHHESNEARIEDLYWHHLAVTFQGGTSRIYIDGVEKSDYYQEGGSRLSQEPTYNVIGGYSTDKFHGTIDDARIYTRVLSAAEVANQARSIIPTVYLNRTTGTVFNPDNASIYESSSSHYYYDDYGNAYIEYLDADVSTLYDDILIERDYNYGESAYIANKVSEERVYSWNDNWVQESKTRYYYDGYNESLTEGPTRGNLTRTQIWEDDQDSISIYCTYDNYGNVLTEKDAKGNVWTTVYESTYHTFPQTITAPNGLSEQYAFYPGTGNIHTHTDVNNKTTTYYYDTFGRIIKVAQPGDSEGSPTIEYEYNYDGGPGQQHLKTLSKLDVNDYLWASEYFDGLGRVIQTQAQGDPGHTIIASTTTYDTRGLVDKQYVAQDIDSSQVNGYYAPEAGWQNSFSIYDARGRATQTIAADGAFTIADYSVPWQQTVTNPNGYKHVYYNDAFERLVQVDELGNPTNPADKDSLYATTTYSYDALGNLVRMDDAKGNFTTMDYDWLSRKTSMTDPDMGYWTYTYDNNGNIQTQTDAKGQTITFTYDNMNRLTGKGYPAGAGMTDIVYTYDSTADGNYGLGRLTRMTDASGTTAYTYDERGRLIEENRVVGSDSYVTSYTYDLAGRLETVTYPNPIPGGERVTQTYDDRSLPETLYSDDTGVGNLVTGTDYNHFGQIKKIDLGNGASTMYRYYGLDDEAPAGYYGRLWQIETTNNTPGDLQDMQYTWDANGNLSQREDAVAEETETFTYDFLDRLLSASGPYTTRSYDYDEIGNIESMNGLSYAYGARPHAVTEVGDLTYDYDANGNMTTRGDQVLTWDVENRLITAGQNPDHAIARWQFNMGVGDIAADTSGNSNHGTINEVTENTWADGKVGGGLSFDGVNDYVRVTDSPSLDILTDITVEAWVLVNNVSVSDLIEKGGADGYVLYIGSSNVFKFAKQCDGNSVAVGTTAIDADTWYHVVGTKSGSTGRIYVNGVLEGTDTSFADFADVGALTLGKGGDGYFDGLIDEVAIYDRALTSEEVEDHYRAGTVAGRWSMNEGAGFTAYDSSGNSNHGTINEVTENTWADGKVGGGLNFDGVNDYVRVTDSPSLDILTDITVEAWVLVNNVSVSDLIEKGGADGYVLYIGSSNVFKFAKQCDGNSVAVGTTAIDADTWYHVVGTKSGSTGRIYVNGVLEGTDTSFADFADVGALTLGKGGDGYFDGLIDEVAIYDRALSQGEIEEHYTSGLPDYSYYIYDEGSSGQSYERPSVSTFVYDGNGNRVLKNEGGETILYVNQYYEKNLTTGEETTHYYLGGREIAYKNDDGLTYVHQDHLGSTALTTDSSGEKVSGINYFPYGSTRSVDDGLGTDKLFTGQRLDDSGLYFYNARYYDSTIGRFISSDSIVPDAKDPQSWNHYSYCLNNPLRYTDPTGMYSEEELKQWFGEAQYNEWDKYDWFMNCLEKAKDGSEFEGKVPGVGYVHGVFVFVDGTPALHVRANDDRLLRNNVENWDEAFGKDIVSIEDFRRHTVPIDAGLSFGITWWVRDKGPYALGTVPGTGSNRIPWTERDFGNGIDVGPDGTVSVNKNMGPILLEGWGRAAPRMAWGGLYMGVGISHIVAGCIKARRFHDPSGFAQAEEGWDLLKYGWEVFSTGEAPTS